MTEREQAEVRKLNEEARTLRHDRWIKRQELKIRRQDTALKWYTALITTFIRSAGLFKIISEIIH